MVEAQPGERQGEADPRPAPGTGPSPAEEARSEQRRRLLRRNRQTIALLGCVFLLSFLLPLLEGTHLRICPFYLITGIPCAGCGMGRSFCALSSGHLLEAFRCHLLGPAVYLALLVALLQRVSEVLLGRRLAWPRRLARLTNPLAILALAVLLGVWVVRLAGYWPLP